MGVVLFAVAVCYEFGGSDQVTRTAALGAFASLFFGSTGARCLFNQLAINTVIGRKPCGMVSSLPCLVTFTSREFQIWGFMAT
jgi:hypothetical protein